MKSCNGIIFDRRSTKSYKPDMPKQEDIDAVIASGLAAASGRNRQASIVVAVTNKEIRDRMSKANAEKCISDAEASAKKILDEAQLQVKKIMTAADGSPVFEDFAHDGN